MTKNNTPVARFLLASALAVGAFAAGTISGGGGVGIGNHDTGTRGGFVSPAAAQGCMPDGMACSPGGIPCCHNFCDNRGGSTGICR